MNKIAYRIALVGLIASAPVIIKSLDVPGLSQAKDILALVPDMIALVNKMQVMPELSKNLKNPTRSKADKIADAARLLSTMQSLQPVLQRLFNISSSVASTFRQQGNADQIKLVGGYVNDGFSALGDVKDLLELAQMMQAQ